MAGTWLNSGANFTSKLTENSQSVIDEWVKHVAGNVPKVLVHYDELMIESYDKDQSATGLYLQFYDQNAGKQSTILCLSTDTNDGTATTAHLRLFLRVIERLEKEGRKSKDAQVSMCLGYAMESGGKFKATSCSNLRPSGGSRRLTTSQEDALKRMCYKAIDTPVASLLQIEAIEEHLKPRIKMDLDQDFVKQLAILGVGKGTNLFEEVARVTAKDLVDEGVDSSKAVSFLAAVCEMNEELALQMLSEAKRNDNIELMRKALVQAKKTKVPDSSLKEFQDWLECRPLTDKNFHEAVKKWLAGGDKQKEVWQKHGHISNWDVAKVKDMAYAFQEAKFFDTPLEKWDVSSVTTMVCMFSGAKSFNQPLEAWNVSKCRLFNCMFEGASCFNRPLEKWDVSNGRHFDGMFKGANSFNQPLKKWDLSECESYEQMFHDSYYKIQPATFDRFAALRKGGDFGKFEKPEYR